MASNEEKARLAAGQSTALIEWSTPNGKGRSDTVHISNGRPYPIEVTVRRVTEKVVYENVLEKEGGDTFSMDWEPETQHITEAAGFRHGQRVRVTVEPLD